MKIDILVSDPLHPVNDHLKYLSKHEDQHEINILNKKKDILGGDILFLISCNEIIKKDIRDLYQKTFVIHASDLPKGRGWSPYIWEILDGKSEFTVSLIEADESVDAGDIWLQEKFRLDGDELLPEIHEILFKCEISLISKIINKFKSIKPVKQSGDPGLYYRKRTPEDSQLDLKKSIDSQFNLLRVADSDRFPAFFIKNGIKYYLKIFKE